MMALTPEQVQYKERTLNQLRLNQQRLEASLEQESRPDVIESIQAQLQDIEDHISRLQDELAGNVLFHEPVADELFREATRALANEKFYLAKKHINRLETIEPFYPGLERLKQEAEAGRVSRRTRSIAQGSATSYPNLPIPTEWGDPAVIPPAAPAPRAQSIEPELGESKPGWFRQFFQFHIVVSCLVILLLVCVVLTIGGMTALQWLIEGG